MLFQCCVLLAHCDWKGIVPHLVHPSLFILMQGVVLHAEDGKVITEGDDDDDDDYLDPEDEGDGLC